MKIMVINGPNLNMLGVREPNIYGRETYHDLVAKIKAYAKDKGVKAAFRQSNHEGDLVDFVQSTHKTYDGIIINPGAYTHTSIALLDAVKSAGTPTVEVHISDPDEREDFRHISYIRGACLTTVKGKGTDGYLEAMDIILEYLKKDR